MQVENEQAPSAPATLAEAWKSFSCDFSRQVDPITLGAIRRAYYAGAAASQAVLRTQPPFLFSDAVYVSGPACNAMFAEINEVFREDVG